MQSRTVDYGTEDVVGSDEAADFDHDKGLPSRTEASIRLGPISPQFMFGSRASLTAGAANRALNKYRICEHPGG